MLCSLLDSYRLKAEKGAFLLMKIFHTLESLACANKDMKRLIGRHLILALFASVIGKEGGHGVVHTCFRTSAPLTYARLGLLNTLIEGSSKNKELILALKGNERSLVQKLYRSADGISQLLLAEILWRLIIPQRKTQKDCVDAAAIAFQPISDVHVSTLLIQTFLKISTSKQDPWSALAPDEKKKTRKVDAIFFERSLRSFQVKFNQLRPQMSATHSRPVHSFLLLQLQFGDRKLPHTDRDIWIDVGVNNLTFKLPDGSDTFSHHHISLPICKISDVREVKAHTANTEIVTRFLLQLSFPNNAEEDLANQPMISNEFWSPTGGEALTLALEMKKEEAVKFASLLEQRRRQETHISLDSSTASSLSNITLLPRVVTRDEQNRSRKFPSALAPRSSLPGVVFNPRSKFGPLSSSPDPRGGMMRQSEIGLSDKRKTRESIAEMPNEDEYDTGYDNTDHCGAASNVSTTKDALGSEEEDDELVVRFRKATPTAHPRANASSSKAPPKAVAPPPPSTKSRPIAKTSIAPPPKSHEPSPAKPVALSKETSKGRSSVLETDKKQQKDSSSPPPSKTPSSTKDSSISRVSPSSDTTLPDYGSTIPSSDVTLDSSKMVVSTPSPRRKSYAPIPIAAEVDVDSGTMISPVTSIKERPKPNIKRPAPPSPPNDPAGTNNKKRGRQETSWVAVLKQGEPTQVEQAAGDDLSSAELLSIFSPTPKKPSPPIRHPSSKLPIPNQSTPKQAATPQRSQEKVWTATMKQSSPKASSVLAQTLSRGEPHLPSLSPLISPNSPTLEQMRRSSMKQIPSNLPSSPRSNDRSLEDEINILARRLDFAAEKDQEEAIDSSQRETSGDRNEFESTQPNEAYGGAQSNPRLQRNIETLMRGLEEMRMDKVKAVEASKERLKEGVSSILFASIAQLSQLIDASSVASTDALNHVADQHCIVLSKFIAAATSQLAQL